MIWYDMNYDSIMYYTTTTWTTTWILLLLICMNTDDMMLFKHAAAIVTYMYTHSLITGYITLPDDDNHMMVDNR